MKQETLLPLTRHAPQDIIAWHQGRPVRCAEFLAQAAALAATLPAAGHAVNLCEDRYLFMLAFAASLLRGQVNLLPPNRAPRVVEEVAAAFPGSYCLVERRQDELALPQHVLGPSLPSPQSVPPVLIPAAQLAVVIFTSGSTGTPRPHRKYWGDLVRGAMRSIDHFGLAQYAGGTIVATVPPQHMYGLESTILFPLLSGLAVHGGRPFFPADVRQTLRDVAQPRVLVTTPVHLRACVAAELHWPASALIISATAPLSAALAAAAEQSFGCEVREIYGCTETGAIASRRTVAGAPWQPYDGVQLHCVADRCTASADFLREPTPLNDVIEMCAEGFVLLGRDSDMVNIGGKRASLGDLTQRLLGIPGVDDAALLLLNADSERGGRLCAFVVAPQLSEQTVLEALRPRVDEVFLPRPIYRVPRLPRNDTGKLPRDELLAMLQRMRGDDGVQ
ncbi:AMP-binding protein [Sulfurivermis fontis]|uniref:AMP-binding protein n=1 Tax=Sulfurivermis fontis TaxID=1972068 RepID=UPI001558B2CF|nr:AMP-binding protein [Sulfurivermis fontis]